MKVIRMLAAAAVVFTAATASAQGGMGGGMGGGQGGQGAAQRQNEMMFKGITLSEEQKAKIDKIQAESREAGMKMREEMQAAGGPTPELRQKMMDARAKTNEAIKAVLTAEQQTAFAKNLEEMAAMGPQRQRPPQN